MPRAAYLAFFSFFVATCLAQDPRTQEPIRKDAAAVQLVTSMNAACGWDRSLPTNVLATGTATTPDGKTEPVIVKAKPGWLRIEAPQSNIILVVNGMVGQINSGGEIRGLNGSEAASIQSLMFPFYTQLATPDDPRLSVASGDGDTVDNKEVQTIDLLVPARIDGRLAALQEAASKMNVAIQPQDFTPVRVRFNRLSRETQDAGVDTDAFLTDFRKVETLLLPFHYEERVDGKSIVSYQFDNITLDAQIPDSDFTLGSSHQF
jgi:hypothetical protein